MMKDTEIFYRTLDMILDLNKHEIYIKEIMQNNYQELSETRNRRQVLIDLLEASMQGNNE